MSIDTYDLMNHGINIPDEYKTQEEKVVEDLSIVARGLAIKYNNPLRYPLDRDDIFAELQVEVSKAIKRYFYCKDYEEFMLISRTMLWNRMRELLTKAYNKYRKKELTAHALKEDYDMDREGSGELIEIFIMSEFLNNLSSLAKKIVTVVLNPDERMQSAILAHIEKRGKLYKRGGIFKIPLSVIQEGIDEDPKLVRKAYKEVREKIKQERTIMGMNAISDKPNNFEGSLVTYMDVLIKGIPVRYERWLKEHLIQQAKFRGVYEEGYGRKELVDALRNDDKNRGLKSDTELPIFPENLADALPKKENPGNGNGMKPGIISKSDGSVETIHSDPHTEDKEKSETLSNIEDEFDIEYFSKTHKNLTNKSQPISEVKKSVEEVKTSEKVESPKEIDRTDIKEVSKSVNVILDVMKLLRAGETLQIEYVKENCWNIRLVTKE